MAFTNKSELCRLDRIIVAEGIFPVSTHQSHTSINGYTRIRLSSKNAYAISIFINHKSRSHPHCQFCNFMSPHIRSIPFSSRLSFVFSIISIWLHPSHGVFFNFILTFHEKTKLKLVICYRIYSDFVDTFSDQNQHSVLVLGAPLAYFFHFGLFHTKIICFALTTHATIKRSIVREKNDEFYS